VLRLGDAVTESNKNVTWVKLYSFFLIVAIREEPHHGASLVQAAHGAIARENDRGKMAGVGIGETVFDVVIKTQEQGCVFFRLGALEEVAVQQPQHLRGRGRRNLGLNGGDARIRAVRRRGSD